MLMESQPNLPESLQHQLRAFRRRVWWVKSCEAIAGAVSGLLIGFLLVYALDRAFDTPPLLRTAVLIGSILTCAMIPVAIDRWILRRRRFEQLALLLAQTRPQVGDQLLGVIELSEDAAEQHRSPELVQAAIRQVAVDVGHQDWRDAVPDPKHRRRVLVAIGLASLVGLLWLVTSAATRNAWARFSRPWSDTPRYTFAAVDKLPDQMVVAHGEPFEVAVQLQPDSQWRPSAARVNFASQSAREAPLQDLAYRFQLPGQMARRDLMIRVGDFRASLPVVPMLRPELNEIDAEIRLPTYLGRPDTIQKPLRGATLSVVRGSETRVRARASRNLATATVNGQPAVPEADQFSTEAVPCQYDQSITLQWQDEFGLQGKQPLELMIEVVDDEAPSVVCEDLPRRKVLLDSEVLAFSVHARDDYGVKRVGIEWKAIRESPSENPSFERIIAAGNATAESMELAATFCARDEKISPQLISLRVFVEDYLPGRERSYGPECVFEILDPSQHAIWVSAQLSRWHRMALDVRDREMRLHQTNQQLRELPPEQLASSENLRRLAEQADQERANGRQLAGLVRNGEALLAEAMRNDDIGVGHLQRWAEMMQVLKDISENRMPGVADLLKQASQQKMASTSDDNAQAPAAGQNRLTQTIEGDSKPKDEQPKPAANQNVPNVADVESTQHQFDPNELKNPGDNQNPTQPRLSLTQTQLAGNGNQSSDSEAPADSEPLDEAVNQQKDLLAEFEKVAGDLNDVLANLEGSTLVKRLKASSRGQQQVAAQLASLVSNSFGVSEREKEADAVAFAELADREINSSQDASNIMDDMAAYFERSRYMLFKRVLDDMRDQDVTAALRSLGEELRKESGLAIAQAEYWSDTFDRWAEDLVEVTQSGACPGAKSKDSLPPSIVLEVLQLLEGEVKLREQTRVAEQARPALTVTEHVDAATRL